MVKIHNEIFMESLIFNFAKVKIRMVDYPNQKPFETILLLDTIKSESPSLTYEESNRLYQEVLKDYEGETKFKQFQKVKASINHEEFIDIVRNKPSHAVAYSLAQTTGPDGSKSDVKKWINDLIGENDVPSP